MKFSTVYVASSVSKCTHALSKDVYKRQWCGYCKRLAPVLKQVAKEHAEAFDILQINIDEFETLAEAYGIETIPTLALLHHGKAQDLSLIHI